MYVPLCKKDSPAISRCVKVNHLLVPNLTIDLPQLAVKNM
jgi:hypothetical protein